MPVIGSQTEQSVKTPTLRQYLKSTGGKVAERCLVTLVFKPGEKSNAFGLVTDKQFRVSVPEDSHLFSWLTINLEAVVNESLCLYVHVTDTQSASWELCEDDSKTTSWETKDYGIRYEEGTLSKPKSRRKPR